MSKSVTIINCIIISNLFSQILNACFERSVFVKKGINGFPDTMAYLREKVERYGESEKSFGVMYGFMFSEKNNVFAETSEGYKIKKLTYGECAKKAEQLATVLAASLDDVPKGEMVGLYMGNCAEWIESFWAILMCGYRPLLLNARLPDEVLENILSEYHVSAVVSEGEEFSVRTLDSNELFAAAVGERYTPSVWGEEVIFMSSGTTGDAKLCAYTAENFYYQINDSVGIVEKCPEIAEGYDGYIKLLALLPFYHVFGFIAMYMWFAFFSSTYVFLSDMKPATILMTIQKHKVSHIFAVPLVWETVYKEAVRKIRSRGDKTYAKFLKALKLSNKHPLLGKIIAGKAFEEIRDNMFGDSIRFLITGGSGIKPEILEFFNGVGYHLANGYGMTEVGITSVEMSSKRSVRNKGSIGYPMKNTEYSINEKGELLVRGRTMATRVMQSGNERATDFEEWFNTHDLAECIGGRYYLHGRRDDLVICENGENLNPEIVERAVFVKGVNRVCLFADENGAPTLLVSVIDCFSIEKLRKYYGEITEKLSENNLNGEIRNVYMTSDRLLFPEDFKLSRRKVAKRFAEGKYKIVDLKNGEAHIRHMLSELEKKVVECFAEALQTDAETISAEADFFTDLGGSSLNYFVLVDLLKTRCGADPAITERTDLLTVRDFCKYIEDHNK